MKNNNTEDIKWPKKAVVTAGMPYGNKSLHFGHVGGVFVPADTYARFLKDRIGHENVLFISGTDCYGSPIDEGYRKAKESGEFSGSINDYVQQNHDKQLSTLKKYGIDLSIYEGSSLGVSGQTHQELTNTVLETLYKNNKLKCIKDKQFYDTKANMFLNGRQVQGRCPFSNCKGQTAYADECDMGHQYAPEDLINPISSVTNTPPILKDVENWYFDLPSYNSWLNNYVDDLENDPSVRSVVVKNIKEFLSPPIIFVKNEYYDKYLNIKDNLPEHKYMPSTGNKQSYTLEFDDIYSRDKAKAILDSASIRYRTGKTLVPFRITGNAAWGVKASSLSEISGSNLTVWCWPESLWAPISFTIAALKNNKRDAEEWLDFWCSEECCVYQFIGQDNIYFYGVAQPALFDGLKPNFDIKLTKLVANHHLLFGKTKASSSGTSKPPSADELLDYYTPEQLRSHWLALGLSAKSVSFDPKPFNKDEKIKNDPRVSDPVLKEGSLLTNVLNRLARSCFYECGTNFSCTIPDVDVDTSMKEFVIDAVKKYEAYMYKQELYMVMQHLDAFIRACNKYWADNISRVSKLELEQGIDVRDGCSPTKDRARVLTTSFYLLYVCSVLTHPIAPFGTHKIFEMFNFEEDKYMSEKEFFSWRNIYNDTMINKLKNHQAKELPPRYDFFKKHKSQFKNK